jgi:6-phosphogluconolactonase (cycloisomerase 2 family)
MMAPLLLLAVSAVLAETKPERVALYASVGAEFTQYDVDLANAALTRRASVTLPANVQYAWPHPSRQFLYVAWSNGGPAGAGSARPPSGNQHGLTAFRIDPASGALHPLGQPVALPSRPIHVSVDPAGTHVLVAYNDPSGLTVHRLNPDGTIGAQMKEPAGLGFGIYAHQIRVDPSSQMAILVTRGNGPTPAKPEDPGALKIFGYKDGVLENRLSIAPNGGFNFQPRHLDFHPTQPWVFLSLERQSKLQVYRKLGGGTLDPVALFTKDSLQDPSHPHAGQAAGTVHVHPNGRFVYQANRASGTVDVASQPVLAGGENTIAVWAIDPHTGEPTLIQSVDTHGVSPRTFALDPAGRILVAANQVPFLVRDESNPAKVSRIPASLAVYRVGGNGKLDFVRKYDLEATDAHSLFWMGLVPLP